MKRQNYQISVNGKPAIVRHTWNAARKATREVLKDHLLITENAELIESAYARNEGGYFHGKETWRAAYGRTIIITINKILEPDPLEGTVTIKFVKENA